MRRRPLGPKEAPCIHKGALLSADERRKALELKRRRFNAEAIARAIGRSVPDVAAYLASPEAQL